MQGVFFNWDYPKNNKYGKKLKYLNWDPPKSSKYGKELKYPNYIYAKSIGFQLATRLAHLAAFSFALKKITSQCFLTSHQAHLL